MIRTLTLLLLFCSLLSARAQISALTVPRSVLQEEEAWDSDAFSPVRTVWPAMDQITNSFIWANTRNGTASVSVVNYDASVDTFIVENRDWWAHAPAARNAISDYVPLAYPHPLTAFPSTPAPSGSARIGTLRAVNVIRR